jgi:prepilin-type N-terminal cleavage/methylation domain-containing protein
MFESPASQSATRASAKPSPRLGFTLIEMSITLVIIGLVVGGIMVGNELIQTAKLRGLITERDKLLTAVSTFRLKYNGLPGDLTNATNFWGTDPGGCPNTAYNTVKKTETCNGIIEGRFTPNTCVEPNVGANREHHRFWQHLSNAGLIDEMVTGATGGSLFYYTQTRGVNSPTSRYGAAIGISTSGHWNCTYPGPSWFPADYGFVILTGKQYTDVFTHMPFLTPLDVFGIDSKIDDGKPGTGKVMTLAPDWPNAANCASSSNPATALYLTTQTGQNCSILYNERL